MPLHRHSPINSQVFVPLARPGSFGRQDSVEPEHSVSASARSYVRKRALRSSAVGGSPDVDADPDAINTGHPDQKRKKTQAVVVDEPRDSPTYNLLNNLPLAVTAATTTQPAIPRKPPIPRLKTCRPCTRDSKSATTLPAAPNPSLRQTLRLALRPLVSQLALDSPMPDGKATSAPKTRCGTPSPGALGKRRSPQV